MNAKLPEKNSVMRRQTTWPVAALLARYGILLGLACMLVLLLAGSARAGGNPKKDARLKEPTAAQLRIARAIAGGHSYEKHVVEEKLFPEVKSRGDFAEQIVKVLANPTHHRKLENDREAFFDSKSDTIVIYNPHARDKGTCFRPRAGLRYFKNLK
jgi:hypothetical protein